MQLVSRIALLALAGYAIGGLTHDIWDLAARRTGQATDCATVSLVRPLCLNR